MKRAQPKTSRRARSSSSGSSHTKRSSPTASSLSLISNPSRGVHNPAYRRKEAVRKLKFTQLRSKLLTDDYTPPLTHKERVARRLYAAPNLGPVKLTPMNAIKESPKPVQTWVFNMDKNRVGITELDHNVFAADTTRVDLVQRVVKWQLANRRAGTHRSLSKSEVNATGKKPFAQKGGGRARAATLVSPIHRGGGRAFPLLQRDYSFSLPKKIRQQALKVALSARRQDGRLFIVDALHAPTHKTGDLDNLMSVWGKKGALIVHGNFEQDPNMVLGLRNNDRFNLLPAKGANVRDILRSPVVLITLQGIRDLQIRANRISPKRTVKFPFMGYTLAPEAPEPKRKPINPIQKYRAALGLDDYDLSEFVQTSTTQDAEKAVVEKHAV